MLKLQIEGKIPVVFFRDDGMVVAYSPALDLSTCGETVKEAQKNFTNCLNIYLKETIKHGTLERDLLKLGWKSNPEKFSILPPEKSYKNIPVNILKRTEIRVPITA